jgi:hypothetical protein
MMAGRKLVALAAVVTLAAACNPDQGSVGPILPTFDRQFERSSAPLVEHIVAPQATDPAIDRFLDNHLVWLDTTAQSNNNLLVFLPGTGLTPAAYQLVQQEAARVGYRVIGLMYPNTPGLAKVCPSDPDPAACYENTRGEIIDGVDRSPLVDVNAANSIDNRLTKLLQYLTAQFPDEGWDRFLISGREPKWSQIAVSGHSQGGGHAAMIAKIRLVARVVMFSAVTDSLGGAAVPWVATHVTPSDRYWGLDHDLDEQFRSIRASWDSLGLAAFGPAAAPETDEPPYGFSHMLVTHYLPLRGPGRAAHGSSCVDANTPLAADGTPLWRDAWDYLLTGSPRRAGNSETPEWGPWSAPVNLGAVVNSPSNDQHPAISKDGLSLYISSDRPGGLGGLDIWVSRRTSLDDPWGAAENLGPNINSVGNDLAPTFSPDGHELYFHSTGRGGCGLADLFVARRHDKRDDFAWEPAENLGCVVNSAFPDAGPTIFADEATGITTLYFTRDTVQNDPPASSQGFDVYASTRTGDEGAFGLPVLVPELSSPFRDTRTTIRRDGLEIILSSGRPGGAGSEDLWVSTRGSTTDPWGTPVNLGPGVNSSAFDGAPALSFDGTTLYFFSERPGGFGKRDLYMTTRTRLRGPDVAGTREARR